MADDKMPALLMSEIYASLVIGSTLAAEIASMEAKGAESEQVASVHWAASEALLAASADAEAMEQAAADALHVAEHERTMRIRQQSKLRLMQTQGADASAVLAELEAERTRGKQRERELREARAKAQQANDRHAAASHGLRNERQQSLRRSRALGARRLASLLVRQQASMALAHSFTCWAAKVAAGIHTTAQFYAALIGAGGGARICAAAESVPPTDPAAQAAAEADGYAQLGRSLDARAAECLRLRERVLALESAQALQHSQQEALELAAARATRATHELLEARRAQAALAAENAELRAHLRRVQTVAHPADGFEPEVEGCIPLSY